MKVSKVPVTVISFVLFFTALHAQFTLPSGSKIEEMKKRQLVVVVNQPNQDLVNKYNRYGYRAAVRAYKQMIYDYNDELQFAVQKFWTFNHKEILYKTWAETNDIINDKDNRDKYVLMYCCSATTHKSLDWVFENDARSYSGSKTYFAIDFPGEDPLTNFNIPFRDIAPTALELTFMVSAVNSCFEYVVSHGGRRDWQGMVNENSSTLSDKTLLLSKKDVSLKAREYIDVDYPGKYKLVDDSTVTNAIVSGDSTAAYIIPYTFDKQPEIWIMSCADGSLLGVTQVDSKDLLSLPKEALEREFFKDIANIYSGKR